MQREEPSGPVTPGEQSAAAVIALVLRIGDLEAGTPGDHLEAAAHRLRLRSLHDDLADARRKFAVIMAEFGK